MKITRRMTITMDVEVTLDASPDLAPRDARLLKLLASDPATVERLLTAEAWTEAAHWMSNQYMTIDADIEGRSATAVIEDIASRMAGPDGDFFRDALRRGELTENTESVHDCIVAQVINVAMSAPDGGIH
jgi:hypothetical protein